MDDLDERASLPVGSNPPLVMACNVYRRQFGVWPERIRFSPRHFYAYVQELSEDQLKLLASVFEVVVSGSERSPRLTVFGLHGAVTYDQGVTDADQDEEPFREWLRSEAFSRGISI